jgi:DNA ligase (NAD+)
MDERQLYDELEQLKQEIHFHNYRYHVLDDPLISDASFDQLLKRLKEIEAMHPEWITVDSPTQRAGAEPAERFEKTRHPQPILSLRTRFPIRMCWIGTSALLNWMHACAQEPLWWNPRSMD